MNHVQTLEIFESDDYYGLDRRNVLIFQQGLIVCEPQEKHFMLQIHASNYV